MRTLPPHLMRSDTNDLRLFEEMRLHPWRPDNKVKIDAFIAMLTVTDPKLAAEMRAKYDQKLKAHLGPKEEAPLPLSDLALKQPEKAEMKEEKKPKKKPSPSKNAPL